MIPNPQWRVPHRAKLPVLAGLLCAALLCGGCAGGVQQAYVAPSNETVVMHSEMSYGGDAQQLHVENRSTVPIVVTGVRLTECENVRERCGAFPKRQQVKPGARVTVLSVRAANPERPFFMRYSFSWEVAGRDVSAALDSLLDTSLVVSAPPTAPTPVRGRALAVGLDSLMMVVGERVSFPALPADQEADSAQPLLVVADERIAAVTGRSVVALRPGRTHLTMRVTHGLVRLPVIVRPGRDEAGVAELVVKPDTLVLPVGSELDLSNTLSVESRGPAGQLAPSVGWSLYVEDETIAALGTGVLKGVRPGRTAVVIQVRGAYARIPVVVRP